MKIAYIATSSIPSSTANSIQVMKVCQALTLNGHETHLFIPARGRLDWDELAVQYGVSVRFDIAGFKSRKYLKRFDFITAALSRARSLGVDVIYSRMLWVASFAQMSGMPVILELHDVPAGRFGKPLFQRYLNSRSKKMTVLITRALGKKIEERFGVKINPTQSIIAPDGVDLERYQNLPDPSAARKTLDLKDTLTAVYTGGFYKGRGLELLLQLAKAHPEIEFLWVGGKKDAIQEWKAIIDQEVLHNITLTGFIANEKLPLYQAAADILLMPFGKTVSGSSGGNTADVCSPMKMFEYMAAGRAILTSDLSVLREVLTENNARFYPPEDFNALNNEFTKLVNDPALRKSLAESARKAAGQYNWQQRMQKILSSF